MVGFKAVDRNGKSIAIKGEIYDSDNEFITAFETVHDGMGKLQLLPIEGKSYYAKIKTATGIEIKQELPKVLQQGYSISFRNFKGRNIVTISTNEATLKQNPNAVLTIVCKARGISYLETSQTLTATTLSFELPKDKTPEGISQITLFDNTNKPQSERLVYIEKEHDLEVELVTDKENYEPDEKVLLNISSKSKEGVVKSASFSLSVTDTNGVEEDDFSSNICSYFLMESDIRGKVNRPAYYFDANKPKRLEHLDNLLLTQGWRDFVWKTIPVFPEKDSYKVEKGITISGRVKQLFADKPLVGNNLTLALMAKKNHGIFNTTTDSIGRFQFENLMFSGKANMYLNTRDDKGKFRGEIVLDSIERSPMLVSLKKEEIVFSESTNLISENVFKKNTAFGVKPENILKEVAITTKIKKENNMVENYGNYGFADITYEADEDTHMFSTIFELMEQKFSNFFKGSDPLYIIDGYVVPEDQKFMVEAVLPMDVVKIDAVGKVQATLFFGGDDSTPGKAHGRNGIIAIYTKPNKGNRIKEVVQSIKKELEGYSAARVFYSPDSEKPDIELDKKAVVRNTLYWNPYVHPDKTGNVSVNYYNTKVETKIKVALEGITATGIPVVENVFYTIKNK